MRTLFARLSFALLCVLLLIGGGFFFVAQAGTKLYYQEITQRLNASIAMYVTGRSQLIENGVVNRAELEALAGQAMVINPSVEIYLLDSSGRILAHALDPDTVVRDRVDLEPIRAMIAGDVEMPLRGSDPRHADVSKIFSAFPVTQDDALQGYLYAILGGQAYDALASDLRGSYILRLIAGALTAIVVGAFLTGLLVFALLTRRLARLSADVRRATDADFDPDFLPAPCGVDPGPAAANDEIGELRRAFARMAARIREQVRRLRETDRLRRELVSNVAHDLRTPLASMHGYIETLMIRNDRLSGDERRKYLEITHRHSERLTRLVGELFELSKLESASVEPEPEDFSLAELLHDVAADFALSAEDRGVKLAVETGGRAARVRADIGLVQRVLENLLQNALDNTPRDGRIAVTLEARPGEIAIAVADTGRGIAAADLAQIFERRYRADGGNGAGSGSAGLGLAIVRKILELHGARIDVSSELGRGTRFEFALPAAQPA